MSKTITVRIPAETEHRALDYLSATAGDKRTRTILRYISTNGGSYLGELSRELAKGKEASRRSIYKRLIYLEGIGVLDSQIEELKLRNPDKSRAKEMALIRRYTISNTHRPWIKKLFGSQAQRHVSSKGRKSNQL